MANEDKTYRPNLRLRVNENGKVTLDDAFAERMAARQREEEERRESIRERAIMRAAREAETPQPPLGEEGRDRVAANETRPQREAATPPEAMTPTPGTTPVRYVNGTMVADDGGNLYARPAVPSTPSSEIADVAGRQPETPAQAAEQAMTGRMTAGTGAEPLQKIGEEAAERKQAGAMAERILQKMHGAAERWDREHPLPATPAGEIPTPDYGAVRRQAEGYYAHLTPEAANEYIREVLHDTDFIPGIVDGAKAAGMSEADYVRERLAPQIQQQVYDKLVEERAPQGTLDYVLSGAMNSLIGQIWEAAMLPREERNLRQAGRAVAGERANGLAEAGNMFMGVVGDLPVFSVLGGANRFLTRGMAAASVRNNTMAAATQIAREMLTFGEYDALNSAVGQWYREGETDWRKVAAAAGKGVLSGAAMGMFGVGSSMLTRDYIARNGFGRTWNYTFRGVPRELRSAEAIRWATDMAGRSAILSLSSVLGQRIENPDFNWDDVAWGEEFKHALMLNLMLDVQNRVMRAGRRDGFEGGVLTADDVSDLQRAGLPVRTERQAYDYVAQTGRLGVLNDRRLSMEQKQKMADLLGLRDRDGGALMLQVNPTTESRIGRTLDERWTVDEYDALGTLNIRRTFGSKEAAEAYREEIQQRVDENRTAMLEGMAEARRQTIGNAESIRVVAEEAGVPVQIVATAVGKEMRGESLNETERSLADEVKEYAETYLEAVPTLSEEVAVEVAARHGQDGEWLAAAREKGEGERTAEERTALREYADALDELLNENPDGETIGHSDGIHAGKPQGTAETEAGRALWESGDTAAQRQQAVRTQVARERLASVAGEEFAANLDARGEAALYDYLYVPDEYMPLVEDYMRQKRTTEAMDAAMEDALRPAMDAARRIVAEMSPTADAQGEQEVQLMRSGEKTYVVRRQVGDVLMVTPIELNEDGTVRWESYDAEVTQAMKWNPRMQYEKRMAEDVVREMVPEYTMARELVHGMPTEEEVLAVEAEGRTEQAPALTSVTNPQTNPVVSEGKGSENIPDVQGNVQENSERTNLSAQWTEDGRLSDGQGGSVWAAPEQTVAKLTEDMGGDRTAALRVVRNKSKQLRRDLEESDRRLDEITDAKEYKAEWDRNRQLRDSIEYWQEVDNSITDIQREAEMPEASKKMRSLMQQLAERLGVELNVTDDMLYEMRRADRRNANKYTEADARRTNGFQKKEGGIIVNSRSVRGLSWAFGHETGHELKDRDPEAYRRWKETILGMMDADRLQEEIKAKRENPTYEGKTEEELTDEIANDQIGEIMADPKKLETFVRKLNPNTLEHLWETTKKWLKGMEDVTFDDVLESAQKAGGKVLDDIRERIDVWRGFKEELTETERLLAEAYKQLAEEIRPIGTGAFGDIYDQFVGKPKEAIEFLKTKKSGEAIGALNHKDVGDIDLVWGEEGTGKSDGYGLAKLVKYHPEVLDNLQGILNDMHITAQTANRIQMESDTHQASVRLTWDNQKKTWLLTAFEKKNSVLGNTTDTDETSGRGKQNDTATLQNTVSTGISGGSSDIVPEPEGKQNGTAPLRNPRFEGKGTENIPDVQGKRQENSERANLSTQGEIQGLEGTSEKEVLDAVRADVERVLEENGVSGVTIKGMALNGSRMRGDAREDSDLDVVMEVEGNVREDDLFNMLSDADLSYEGIKVDVNPIMRGKSGTLEEYMKRSRAYDDEMRFSAEIELHDKKTGDDDLAFGKKFVSLHSERDREAVSGQRERFAPTAQWREGVDDVMVHTTLATMRKKHGELHDRAKAGDVEAALELVAAVVKPEKVKALAETHPDARVAFVHAEEATGRNAIPKAYAECLEYHGLQLADIEQINKPAHTGSDRVGRFFRRARFDGEVEAGREYILVDDHVTMGGTLRDLKDYIESKGGKVVAVSTLTASAGSTKLRPTEEQIRQLNEKGITNEQLERAGIADSFDGLTRSEAREILVLADAGGDRGSSQRREGSRTRPQVLEGVLRTEDGVSDEKHSQRIAPEEGEHWLDYARRVAHIRRLAVDTNPSEAQKEAGNYKKGHLKVDGYNITIENPRGTTRSGKDADGKEWSVKMNYDYGYIRGTEGVDGDHIDVYLSEKPEEGNVYVVDQIDQRTGKFDEHKVMYGFPTEEAAREAYLSQYEDGWKIGKVTEVSREQFKKWVDSSHRKTKPFSEYAIVQKSQHDVRFSAEDKEKVFEAAKRHFGVTRDLREAAYILPDGAMLDFSGRHQMDPGMDSRDLAGRRTNDHRDIKQLNYEADGNTPSGLDVHMADFIERGAIRIDANSGVINMSVKPTREQRLMLQRLIQRNDGDVSVDFGNGDNSDHYVEYEGARPARVFSDIDKYFDEGLKPEGNIRFSAEDGAGIDMSEVDTIEAKPEKNGAIAGIGIQLKMKDGNKYRLFVRTDDESAENYGQVEFYGKDGQDIPDEEMTKRFGSLFGAQADEVFGPSISQKIMSGNKFKYHPAGVQKKYIRQNNALRAGQHGDWKNWGEKALTERNVNYFLYGMSNRYLSQMPGEWPGSKVRHKFETHDAEGVPQIDTKRAQREKDLVTPLLQKWRDELIDVRYSNVPTDDARREIDSVIHDLDYSMNWYERVAGGDEDFYRTMDMPRFSTEREDPTEKRRARGPIFYSNAQRAVEGIRQEKATPEQWLKMIEKAGGLKAGEDKWTGLSEWLQDASGKPKRTLTKQEVMDYIRENSIQVEETPYAVLEIESSPKMQELREEYDRIRLELEGNRSTLEVELDDFMDRMYKKYGRGWYDKLNEEELEYEERFEDLNSSEGTTDEKAFREMVKRYGDDFEMAFEVDGNGRLSPQYDYDGRLMDVARSFLEIEDRPIESRRLEYTTEGLENKREIALTVPTIEPWNEGDEIHFGDAGEGRAVAWARFGETTDKDGNRVLVIDEIQSKRHQEGREKGYRTAEAVAEEERLVEAVGKAQEAYDEYTRRMGEKYDGAYEDIYADMTEGERAQADRLEQEVSVADERYQNHKMPDVPEAPFEKNWHELAMKRMLRLAAEEGYDKVAWTTGMQQAERYDIGKVIDQVERSWIDYATGEVRYDLQPKDNSGGISLFVNVKDGMVTRSAREEFEGKPLSDVVGKELAEKMLEMEDYSSLNIADMNLGGEGMRGFYDQMLPRFMDKYGKRWGVKTYDQEYQVADDGHVENGKMVYTTNYTWHTVDVTPEMRESVMEGQPMFSAEAETEYRRLSDIVEKPYRIEKLRNSKPVEITGDEYGRDYTDRSSAKEWAKKHIKGEYRNEDTGEYIQVSNVGIKEVTSHGTTNDAHMKSLAAIPKMIEHGILISEQSNRKGNDKYDQYQYFVCGLKIGDEDYTAKIVVGVKDGSRFYDHRLSQIEKGKLIDSLNGLSNTVAGNQTSLLSDGKGTTLESILQTNPQEIADARAKMREMEAEMAERPNRSAQEDVRFSAEGRSQEWKKAERELAGHGDALRVLRDTQERDIEEVAAGVLARGGLLWADEGEGQYRKKGVKSMMGWSDGERKNFLGMFKTAENGGISVAEAGEAVELACREAGIPYDESDAMAGVNAIQDVLGNVETMSDLTRYVERRRIDEAYGMVEEAATKEREARDAWYMKNYGMTYDDYQETLTHDAGQQAENAQQTEMIEWQKQRISRQAEQLERLQGKLDELKHAELGRPLVIAQNKIIEQQQEDIREAKTEANRLKDELRYKKNYDKAYHELMEVKKQLSAFVRERMAADDMPFASKRELNKLLSTIEHTNTLEQMEDAITDVKTVVNRSHLRHLRHRLARLMDMKVQGVNGRNMSVAKTVDDRVRRIIEDIRGRVADIGMSGLEDDLDALLRERRQTRTAINDAQKNGQTEEADVLEAHWRDLSDQIQAKEGEIADLLEQRHGKGKIDVGQEINDLEEKFDKFMSKEKGVTWTETDADRLTALYGVQIIEESKEQAIEVNKIERSIADKWKEVYALREKLKDEALSRDEKKDVRDEINAVITRISAEKGLLADALQSEAESVQHSVDAMEELMDDGRNNLKKRVDAQLMHRMEILKGAFSDIRVEGKEPNYNLGERTLKETPSIKIPLTCNIGSFEYMCKRISQSGTSGEDGWIYQHFVKGDNGVMAAYNTYERGLKQQKDQLNEKVTEVFGTKNDRYFNTDAWTRQAAKADKVEMQSGVSIRKDVNTPERIELPLSKGAATYLYMVWKMDDGKMKMKMQGFDEQSMQEIEDFIGPKYKQLADWLQEKFLTESRARYNERYVEMYNTSMARIKNYVPLRVNKDATRQESSLSDDKQRKQTLEQRAGSLINRTVNLLPVDITKSVFDVISEHVESMEKWYAYAPVRRDLDAILSSTYFRNQLDINNAGHFKRFYDAAAVATQSYMPPAADHGDKFMALMTRGLLSGNIAWRFATAIKQLYSATAFLGYTYDPKFAGYLAKNLGSSIMGRNIKWCIQNIPSFAERADVGDVGNYRLREKIGTVRTESAGRFLKQLGLVKAGEKVENIRWELVGRFLQKYTKIGMLPNRAIDLFTCGLGAKTIYDYKLAELKRAIDNDGTLTPDGRKKALEEAHKKAVMEADIFYNSTQQSSNPMFMSPMQVGRGAMDRALSAYQNSNLGYVRKMLGHALDLVRSVQFKKMVDAYERRYIADGMDKDAAHDRARQQTLSVMGKSLLGLYVMGWLNNAVWNRGSSGFFGWLADPLEDEDKRKENETDEEYAHRKNWDQMLGYLGMAARPIQGTPLGNILIDLSEMRGYNPLLAFDELNELANDMQKVLKHHGVFSQQTLWMLTNRALRTSGINMETLGNIYFGVEQMLLDGGGWDEKKIDLMFILNTPNKGRAAAARNLYKDASLEEYVAAVAKAEKYLRRGESLAQWFPWMEYAEGDKFGREYNKLQKEWEAAHEDLKNMNEKEFDQILQQNKDAGEKRSLSDANKIYGQYLSLEDRVDDGYIERKAETWKKAEKALDALKKDTLLRDAYVNKMIQEGKIKAPENEEERINARADAYNDMVKRVKPYSELKKKYDEYKRHANKLKLQLDGGDNDTATMETIRQLRDTFLREIEASDVE